MVEPAPHPEPDSEIGREYWNRVADGQLPLQRCGSCGATTHPPRFACPECYAEDWRFVAAEGTGRVLTYTAIHRPAADRFADEVPITSAVVELAEGPRVMGVLDRPIEDVSVGLTVELDPSNLSTDDRRLVFEPIE